MRKELECKFCLANWNKHVPAQVAAPQFDGGDEDYPCVWVPVCLSHFQNWYEDIIDPLPWFKINHGVS